MTFRDEVTGALPQEIQVGGLTYKLEPRSRFGFEVGDPYRGPAQVGGTYCYWLYHRDDGTWTTQVDQTSYATPDEAVLAGVMAELLGRQRDLLASLRRVAFMSELLGKLEDPAHEL